MVYLQTVMQRSKVCARIILHVCVTNIATPITGQNMQKCKNGSESCCKKVNELLFKEIGTDL